MPCRTQEIQNCAIQKTRQTFKKGWKKNSFCILFQDFDVNLLWIDPCISLRQIQCAMCMQLRTGKCRAVLGQQWLFEKARVENTMLKRNSFIHFFRRLPWNFCENIFLAIRKNWSLHQLWCMELRAGLWWWATANNDPDAKCICRCPRCRRCTIGNNKSTKVAKALSPQKKTWYILKSKQEQGFKLRAPHIYFVQFSWTSPINLRMAMVEAVKVKSMGGWGA